METPTLPQQIEFFFAPPLPPQAGVASPLHLLRREAQLCLLGDVVPEESVGSDQRRNRLFATCMVIMAGIDLLAKFHAGDDADGKSRKRFETFLSEYVSSGPATATMSFAEVIYLGFRNPVVHSFSLYSKKVTVSLAQGLGRGAVVRPVGRGPDEPEQFVISLEDLFLAFLHAVREYQSDLKTRDDLQGNFARMFPLYGSLRIETFSA